MISKRVALIFVFLMLTCFAAMPNYIGKGVLMPRVMHERTNSSISEGRWPSGARTAAMFAVTCALIFFRVRRKHQALFGETRVDVENLQFPVVNVHVPKLRSVTTGTSETFATLAET